MIADSSKLQTEPEHALQPDGSAMPWGVGALLSNSTFDVTSTVNSTLNATDTVNGTTTANSASSWPTPEGHNASIAFLELGACSAEVLCPETAPCCSQYGYCGTGRNCLSGCNPLASFQPGACAPIPACQDNEVSVRDFGAARAIFLTTSIPQLTFEHDSASRILANGTTWDGDSLKFDWVIESSERISHRVSVAD